MSAVATAPAAFDAGLAGHRGLDLVAGRGAFVHDTNGNEYLDATSMYGVASLGHGHPELAAALADQARRMVACFGSFGSDQRAQLLQRLHGLLQPLDRFFLCNSGTEAVEAALKLARASTARAGVVALSGGFHGRTLGALSATFRARHREVFQPLLGGVTHVRPGDLAGLEAAVDETTGLVLVEVIQGEGGVRAVAPEFLAACQRLARERGALFAVDEVQTGIGRTGRWFGFEEGGLEPDVVCLAKGLGGGVPIGVMGYRSSRAELAKGLHGSTFGGNPLSCRAALTVLEVIEREGLVERAAEHGERLMARLRAGCEPRAAGPVRALRGRGLMIGIELTAPALGVQQRLQERGFLTLAAGPRVLRLLPPLVTPWAELERLADAILEEVQA